MPKTNDTNMNLDAHYSSSGKVVRTKRVVVAPKSVPQNKVIKPDELDKRWKALSNDIYEGTQSAKDKTSGVFSYILGVGAVYLGIIGIKRLIKFFKK